MTIELDCGYDDAPHEFPDDWVFGGADGNDPGADPRWQPTTYRYLDAMLREVHVTQTPLCMEAALDYFTSVTEWGLLPVYLQVRKPGDRDFEIVDWQYNPATDTVHPIG